jgi:hypothetical protein
VKTTHRTGSDCDNGWINSFEYTVSDACGNVYPPFKIIYQGSDQSAPEWFIPGKIWTIDAEGYCPDDASVSLEVGDMINVNTVYSFSGADVYLWTPSFPEDKAVSDNCTADEDIVIEVVSKETTNDGCESIISIGLVATDLCGNSSDVYYKYHRTIDSVAPVVDCPAGPIDLGNDPEIDQNYLNNAGQLISTQALADVFDANDNCGGALNTSITNIDGFIGNITHTAVDNGYDVVFTLYHTATDACGNRSDVCNVTYTYFVTWPPNTRTSTILADGDVSEDPGSASSSNDSEMSFRAYPVPFNGEVTIAYNFNFDTDVTVEVYDTKGMLVLSKEASYLRGTDATMPLAINGSDQMYYIKVITDQGTMTKKVVATSGN